MRSRWYRDRLGRPVKQETLTGGDFSQRARTYQWSVNDRLQQMEDSQRGLTRFGHDDFGNLAWSENPDGSMLYRMPDAVGNLFRTKDRKDRKYGRAGQLLQSGNTRYKYDAEGNLIRKAAADGKGWHYEWSAAGMLRRVIRPDGENITFTYDALGRRLSKTYRGRTTHWLWDGNIPLHEWIEQANFKASAKQLALEAGADGGYHSENLVTWLFEPESFAPLAKLTNQAAFDIVSDHLGTPVSMHAPTGETMWSADLNGYGEVLNLRGKAEDCPFRYPGQYEDVETGLYYNRFRYYDAREGLYLSRDPIGLLGGSRLYGYVRNPLIGIDPFGLAGTIIIVGIVYRSGSSTLNNYTPAPKDLPGGLSSFNSTEVMIKKLPSTQKAQMIDISKLGPDLEAVLDGKDGHVSIRPKADTDGKKLESWSKLKGLDNVDNSLAEQVKQARTGEWKKCS